MGIVAGILSRRSQFILTDKRELAAVSPAAVQPHEQLPELLTELQTDRSAPEKSMEVARGTGVLPKTVLPPKSSAKPIKSTLAQGALPKSKKALGDPVARVALSWVGVDPEADAYWVEAINDPTLSAHERQDLIEDLNEEGFFDPHHPTLDDLPLIVSRLELIEELEADAMDDVNSDAFAEAKKDLRNMALASQR
jgi:hypothetical protein